MKTAQQVAAELGYNDAHIRRLCIAGKLRAIKFGRQWIIGEDEVARLSNLPRHGRRSKGKTVADVTD